MRYETAPEAMRYETASEAMRLETEAMRAWDAGRLLTTLAAFGGLPTAHLAQLPEDIRSACESRRAAIAPTRAGRRLRAVDTRMLAHTARALPPPVAAELQAAFQPFNELLRTLLNDVAPTLRDVRWM